MLIPQPSDDPNDPLNWSTFKKALAFTPIIIFTALGNWVAAGLGFAIPILIADFGHSFSATAQGLIGFTVLALGCGVHWLLIPF